MCGGGQSPWGSSETADYPGKRATIFTDSQAAIILRVVSEQPGPAQKCAIRSRMWTAVLRAARPEISIEIRWCPAH